MKKFVLMFTTVLLLVACSEQKQQGTKGNQYYPEDPDEDSTYVTLQEAGGDSLLVGSSNYSATERELEVLLFEAENVRSTYMLQLLLEHYDTDIQRLRQKVDQQERSGGCTAEEMATMRQTLSAIESTAEDRWYSYSVVGVGVVANLNYLLRSVNGAHSKAELDKVLDHRTGFLQTLHTLHLVVQEPSQQKEVHRLAKELQRVVERKREELK